MSDAQLSRTCDVVVIGGANVDTKSRIHRAATLHTSNPGRTRTSAGGVGRNVAASLAALGVNTALISAVGNDAAGRELLAATEASGVDVSLVSVSAEHSTGSYIAVLDEHGALVIAVSSMDIVDTIGPDVIAAHTSRIGSARWLVLDANLPVETLRAALVVAREANVAVAIDPVSVAKAVRVATVLAADLPVALCTPNVDELAVLLGANGDGRDIASLHARGVANVWVRCGADGSQLHTVDGTFTIPTLEVANDELADVTGAGDAALAGYVWAALGGHAPVSCARYGTAAALAALRSIASDTAASDLEQLHADEARLRRLNEKQD